jgi:hypothetical protein
VLTVGFARRADDFDAPTEHDAKSVVHFLGMGRKNSERHDDGVQISFRSEFAVHLFQRPPDRRPALGQTHTTNRSWTGPSNIIESDLHFFNQILLHVRELVIIYFHIPVIVFPTAKQPNITFTFFSLAKYLSFFRSKPNTTSDIAQRQYKLGIIFAGMSCQLL